METDNRQDKQQQQQQQQIVELQLLAGTDEQGKSVMENIEAYALTKKNHYEMIRSPLFLRNLAAGDIFSINGTKPGQANIEQRSGKLCIRVFRKEHIEEVELRLTPEVEKLDGSLDITTEKALVYSLHVNIGFGEIESLFDGLMAQFTDLVWYYGNVYDPNDGITPLSWWDEFLNTV